MQSVHVWSPSKADGVVPQPVTAAFDALLAAARASAAAASEAPAEALHDYRRALRKLGALVALTRPALRAFPARWLDASLAHALRQTSAMRDAAALAARMARLAELVPELAATEPAAIDALAAVVLARRDDLGSGENVAWRLRKNVRALAGLGEVFAAALRKADSDHLGAGLRRVYRDARRAWKTARDTGRRHDVHAFRRATRTLRDALELFAATPVSAAEADLHAPREACRVIVRMLGLATDLMALDAVTRAAEASPLEAAREPMLAAMGRVQTEQVLAALGAAELFFAPSPRAFLVPGPVAPPSEASPTPSEASPAGVAGPDGRTEG